MDDREVVLDCINYIYKFQSYKDHAHTGLSSDFASESYTTQMTILKSDCEINTNNEIVLI